MELKRDPKYKIQAKRFVRFLNEEFGAPFLPEGFVEAELTDDMIRVRIGRRDAEIGIYSDRLFGSGTDLTGSWEIIDRRSQTLQAVRKRRKRGSKKDGK